MEKQKKVSLIKIPIIEPSLKRSYIYKLSDLSYGELLIFEEDEPKYYFNVLDSRYAKIEGYLMVHKEENIEDVLKRSFTINQLNLRLNSKKIGLKLQREATSVNFQLDWYPIKYFDFI